MYVSLKRFRPGNKSEGGRTFVIWSREIVGAEGLRDVNHTQTK